MKNNALISKINLVFGIIMGLVYITAGLFVYFSDVLHFSQVTIKIVVSVSFILYGFFRFYRTYRKSVEENQIQEESNED